MTASCAPNEMTSSPSWGLRHAESDRRVSGGCARVAPGESESNSCGEPTAGKLAGELFSAGDEQPRVRWTMDQRQRVAALVEAHFDVVWRTLRRLGLSDEDAADGAQQVFLIAGEKLEQVIPTRERSFLVGVAYRVAANARRAVTRRWASGTEDPTECLSPSGWKPADEVAEGRRLRRVLERILATMPLQLRTVFVLYELEGWSTPEIAGSLGIPLGTAASRLRKARALFEGELERVRPALDKTGGGA